MVVVHEVPLFVVRYIVVLASAGTRYRPGIAAIVPLPLGIAAGNAVAAVQLVPVALYAVCVPAGFIAIKPEPSLATTANCAPAIAREVHTRPSGLDIKTPDVYEPATKLVPLLAIE